MERVSKDNDDERLPQSMMQLANRSSHNLVKPQQEDIYYHIRAIRLGCLHQMQTSEPYKHDDFMKKFGTREMAIDYLATEVST
jgi:hypothetical protein